MTDYFLFDGATLLAYCAAASALVIAPGPGQALVVARSIAGGTRAGLLTSLGLEIGTLMHTLAAALGLSALLATSASAFAVLKYLGATYLVVLGLQALWRAGRQPARASAPPTASNGGALVLHAAMAGTLNPKVALFFLAFLPQFVDPERGSALVQFLVLGLLLTMLGFTFDAAIATMAGRARRRLAASARFARWRERVMGGVLLGLGVRLAFTQASGQR